MLTLNTFIEEWNSLSKTIMVQTSGSTGAPKHMMVEKARMVASAKMTCQFLGLKPHDTALLCMNLDYIAAKMMVVRALTCGMKLVDVGKMAVLRDPAMQAAVLASAQTEALKLAAENSTGAGIALAAVATAENAAPEAAAQAEQAVQKARPKFCTECGAKLEGGKFCRECGHPLGG